MAKYECEGFRSVEADSLERAAAVFARRAAFRSQGRGGVVYRLRLDHFQRGGGWGEFSAFLARPAREGGGYVGHDVTLCVSRCEGGRV